MKKIIKWGIILITIILMVVLTLNFVVILSTNKRIVSNQNKLDDIDCILVLGAAVWEDKPSWMLQDRLDTAIDLYKEKKTKIIMSGDHSQNSYDEVNVMKQYAIDQGVASEDIFMDHVGISTYDSIYRAKYIFGVKKMIVVTQKYHLYRSLYIAKSLGIESYGIEAYPKEYGGQFFREVREVLARDKDFVKCIWKPKSKYLGEMIPISGNGDITNDKKEI